MIEVNKTRISGKKLLYTVCFAFLGMIDFIRHTQQENWWGPIVNCTGIVIMIITLSAYKLKELRCRFSYIWSGILSVLLALCAIWPKQHLEGIYKWTAFTAIINIWLIGILAYRVLTGIFVKKDIKIKWDTISILAILLVLFMMLSPYHAVWPVWFLAVFSLFYLTEFDRSDFKDLQKAMADGIIITFFILQIYAYGFRPFDVNRYIGAFSNSNMTALHYVVTYLAILIEIYILTLNRKAKKWRYLFWAGAAIILDFQILTMTRTAWVVSMFITIVFGVVVVKKIGRQSWAGVLVKGIALGMAVLIFFPLVFAAARWFPTILHHPIWYEGEWGEEKVHSFDPADSEKYTDFNEFMEDILGRLQILRSIDNGLVMHVQAKETVEYPVISLEGPENLTKSLRIRLTIYKAYLGELTWRGHKKIEGHYTIFNENGAHMFVWHPQNLWIYIIYYYGIPAGTFLLVLFILILKKQICMAAANKRENFAFISLLVSIAFLMYGLMEIVWIIGQLILTLFLFVQHPQFFRENKVGENRDD